MSLFRGEKPSMPTYQIVARNVEGCPYEGKLRHMQVGHMGYVIPWAPRGPNNDELYGDLNVRPTRFGTATMRIHCVAPGKFVVGMTSVSQSEPKPASLPEADWPVVTFTVRSSKNGLRQVNAQGWSMREDGYLVFWMYQEDLNLKNVVALFAPDAWDSVVRDG